jgi:hypothetical protein
MVNFVPWKSWLNNFAMGNKQPIRSPSFNRHGLFPNTAKAFVVPDDSEALKFSVSCALILDKADFTEASEVCVFLLNRILGSKLSRACQLARSIFMCSNGTVKHFWVHIQVWKCSTSLTLGMQRSS